MRFTPDGELSYLLPGAHAAIDLMDQATANHLEQYDASAGIEHLLVCRAVRLVLHVRVRAGTLSINTYTHHVGYIDLG